MKIAILILYFGLLIAIGLYCRKHTTDVNGFVLGGRSVGPWLTAFAYGTSYFSAVVFVGYAGQFGWKYGIAATWAGIGNALIGSLMAWFILGRRTRIMSQHLDSATMPQFFGKRFGSDGLKIGASIIIFIFMIPYTASLYNGLSRLFGMAFSIDYSVCILLMAVLTAIYVIAGGYMATAINDFIQGVIMLVGISAVIVAVLESKGGFMSALDGLARITDEKVASTPGIFASFFGPDPINLLFVVILTSLGTWFRNSTPSITSRQFRKVPSSRRCSHSSSPAAAISSAASADCSPIKSTLPRTASTPSSRPCSRDYRRV